MNEAFEFSLALTLADGSAWHIIPGHHEAADVVQALGAIMQLRPGDQPGRPLVVVTRGHHPAVCLPGRSGTPLVCDVGAGVEVSPDLFPIQVSRLALAIACDAQTRGGVLLHGALAEWGGGSGGFDTLRCPIQRRPSRSKATYRGQAGCPQNRSLDFDVAQSGGFDTLRYSTDAGSPIGDVGLSGQAIILAGPGTVGKTTASQRLPRPWRSLSDDATLVVRDEQGQYWAHPWPTWSWFYGDGPGGSWDVQRAVPLRAVFFLSQAPDDRVEPVTTAQAVALLMESVAQVAGPMMHGLEEEEERAIRKEWLAAVNSLALGVPAYTLHFSLTGAFWEEIERVMSEPLAPHTPHALPLTPHVSRFTHRVSRFTHHVSRFTHRVSPVAGAWPDSALSVVYTGPSMNPTLRQPDLLTVVPYGDRPLRPGDVVYFRSPEKDHAVVHRVVQVTSQGIRTRGDSNRSDDPYLLQPSEVIGKVVAARDAWRERPVAGGRRGQLTRHGVVLWHLASRLSSRLLHGAYYALARTGLFRRLLPARLRPRVFVFRSRHRRLFRLMMGRREVGHYDDSRGKWHIDRPFRLFVDQAKLPQPHVDSERAALRFRAAQRPNASSSPSPNPRW